MCKNCNYTGLTMIDVDAPSGNGCIEEYCDCSFGEKLAESEICTKCGDHKNETPEKKVYTSFGTKHRFCYFCMLEISKN